MTTQSLPALDGRTPLGFLAALGVLRLITDHAQPDDPDPRGPASNTPRLAWSTRDCTAVLHSPHGTLDDLVTHLERIVQAIPQDGVLPAMPAHFPPPGEAPDRLRLPRPDLRVLAGELSRTYGPAVERWLSALVTDLSVDEKQRADISQFAAPSGKQSMRTMLQKPLDRVRAEPGLLREALTAWRRYPGVSGEYLDHRVLFDSVDAADGRSAERGVPGATWLALMSYPLFLTTGIGGEPVTTCWQRLGTAERRMVYPLWSEPLDSYGVRALLDHHVLGAAEPGSPPADARLLGTFLVVHAERRRIAGRTFSGVLTPTSRPVRPTAVKRPAQAGRRRS